MVNKNHLFFPICFMVMGIVIQIIAYNLGNDSLLSLISGIFGVFAVILTSLKKMSMYVFGFLQLGTYMILAYQNRLYGEFVENIFYAITMVIGVFVWKNHYDGNQVETRSLKFNEQILTMFGIAVGTVILYVILLYTDDSQPFIDSISTIPAFIAQILMIMRYREQWILWIIVDVTSCVLWFNAHNWCMLAQYAFWTINCLYGWYLWKQQFKINKLKK